MKKSSLVEIAALIVVFAAVVFYSQRRAGSPSEPAPAPAYAPTAPQIVATPAMKEGGIEIDFTTSDGPFQLTLWPKLAPKHVEQIVKLAKAGLYDGSVIFRVEKGFVIQFGGDYERPAPLTPAQQALVAKIPAEFSDVRHERGIVSMARNDDPDSATTSFSILLGKAPHLDGKYTVLGEMSPASEPTLQKVESEAVVAGTTKPQNPITVIKAEVR